MKLADLNAWAPEDIAAHTADPDTGGSSLFVALQEQLGLKLETRKSPVDCIVIYHDETPSKN